MLAFHQFWYRLQLELAYWRTIRNWTEYGGYTSKQTCICFRACSYLACTETQRRWVDPHLALSSYGENWIVCSQLNGKGYCKVSKAELENIYSAWPKYRAGQIKRAELGKGTASPYAISLLKWFEELPDDTPAARAAEEVRLSRSSDSDKTAKCGLWLSV